MPRHVDAYSLGKIKAWEGLRLDPYQDQAGVWTDGYGNTRGVVAGKAITAAKAESDLRRNLAEAEAAVSRLVTVDLNDYQFGALVAFVFNVGVSAFASSTLLRMLNQGNYAAVPVQLMRWNKITVGGRKIINKGLTNRRSAECGLWSRGEFVASQDVDVAAPAKLTGSKTLKGAAITTIGTAGATLTDASQQVSVVAEYSDTLRTIFIILTVAGIALTIYGRIQVQKRTGE